MKAILILDHYSGHKGDEIENKATEISLEPKGDRVLALGINFCPVEQNGVAAIRY